jgi:hypothetical protein
MEILEIIVGVLHGIGFLLLFGLLVMQVNKTPIVVKTGMFHGVLTQLVTGLLLVALGGKDVNHIAAAVKLVILLVIGGTLLYLRKKEGGIITKPFYYGLIILTLCEVLIALLWIDVGE